MKKLRCQPGLIPCGGICFQAGAACGTGLPGECAAGTLACQEGDVIICVSDHTPVAETCNGLDDDCDGEIDNDAVCPARPNVFGRACLAGQCVYTCFAGFGDCDGDPDTPCETFFLDSDPNHCGGCNIPCSGPCGTPEEPGTNVCHNGLCLCQLSL